MINFLTMFIETWNTMLKLCLHLHTVCTLELRRPNPCITATTMRLTSSDWFSFIERGRKEKKTISNIHYTIYLMTNYQSKLYYTICRKIGKLEIIYSETSKDLKIQIWIFLNNIIIFCHWITFLFCLFQAIRRMRERYKEKEYIKFNCISF